MDPITMAALIQTGSQLIGGLMQGKGQAKDAELARQQQIKTLLAQLDANRAQFETSRQDQQGKLGLEVANSVPERVGWRQNQAVRAALMPEMRNVNIMAPAGMQQFVPQMSGGLKIPEGGFGPDTLKFFSENARLQGEADLDTAGMNATGGQGSTPSYSAIYGGPTAANTESRVANVGTDLRIQEEANRKKRQEALTGSLRAATVKK